jgi:hypothetical protein
VSDIYGFTMRFQLFFGMDWQIFALFYILFDIFYVIWSCNYLTIRKVIME